MKRIKANLIYWILWYGFLIWLFIEADKNTDVYGLLIMFAGIALFILPPFVAHLYNENRELHEFVEKLEKGELRFMSKEEYRRWFKNVFGKNP